MGTIPPTSQPAVEVEFAIADHSYPFVMASSEAECRLELRETLPRGEDRYAEFFRMTDADPDRVLELLEADADVEARLLAGHDTGGLFEFLVPERCPIRTLARSGATPIGATSTDGDGRIVARIPPRNEASDVVATFLEEHPAAVLVAKRTHDCPSVPFADVGDQELLEERLTDRQREVLEAAYDAGYFERPRGATGEELADELGIRPSTFSQHVRAAQHNLLEVLYEEDSV